MKNEEKDRKHLARQNRQLRRLRLRIAKPLLLLLPISVVLLLFGVFACLRAPGESFFVSFSGIASVTPHGRIYTLETATGERYYLPWQILENGLRKDIRSGVVQPGDVMQLSCYPWLFHDGIATLSCGGKEYGNLTLFERTRASDARRWFWCAGLFFVPDAVMLGLSYAADRKELRQAKRLRRKYMDSP